MKNNICPVCNREVKSSELLLAYYYEPKDWWVIKHLVPKTDKDELVPVIHSQHGIPVPGMTSYCSAARYNAPTQ